MAQASGGRRVRVVLVTPAPPGSRAGNRVTASRWARILRGLGHRATVTSAWVGGPCDLLVALHARKSFDSVARFRREHPDRPVVVALTGTDLYLDLRRSARARTAIALADRLVLLQPLGRAMLPAGVRSKARVIFQSAAATTAPGPRSKRTFPVVVLAHLRKVKDPFRAALASRALPQGSRVRILHAGASLDASMERRARREEQENPRYRWVGELSRAKALRLLAQSRVLVVSSRVEGGANAVAEALAHGVPVLASRVAGNVGMLGETYPGYFEAGDTRGLERLLRRAESEPPFLALLRARCRRLRSRVSPARETECWARLVRELAALRTGARSSGRGTQRARRGSHRARRGTRLPGRSAVLAAGRGPSARPD